LYFTLQANSKYGETLNQNACDNILIRKNEEKKSYSMVRQDIRIEET
jgi:hypothetical protein